MSRLLTVALVVSALGFAAASPGPQPPAGLGPRAHEPAPRLPAGAQIVEAGGFFTGVVSGAQSFAFPLTLDGFDPELGELLSVRVTLDTRLSGEYVIQPTPVPPNGTVSADATTRMSLDGKPLVTNVQRFAPIPWVFPVSGYLSVLWALDLLQAETTTDPPLLAAFSSGLPVELLATVDLLTKVNPPGWASPHVAGILASWEVRYTYR